MSRDLLLMWGVPVLLLACSQPASPPTAEQTCCTCLAEKQTPRGVPCLEGDGGAAACVDVLGRDAPLETSPVCLRDVCATACKPLGFNPASRGVLEGCCGCLATRTGTTGAPCITGGAETCANTLDDGQQLATQVGCLEQACGAECAFVERPDGGA